MTKERHIALIVEDDSETAESLGEILQSLDCDNIVVDNRDQALVELQKKSFCLILLDLNIKGDRDSIKGHVEHGKALLRKIRQQHGDHYGVRYWLPVLVVSGFAREADQAVEVMKDGASDVIQKPFDTGRVSETIREALQASGRLVHSRCHEAPRERLNLTGGVVVSIPGERKGRRTCVTVASKLVQLTNNSLKVLLRLMIAQLKGAPVHKIELGASSEQGFKGVSVLRNELRSVLGDTDIVKNHYYGYYSFADDVRIGDCSMQKLVEIGDATISKLAAELQGLPHSAKKSEGKSKKFPVHRRRR